MKDLGFGILDRRTVIVTLLTIVITNVFFQFNLPIRINNAGDFFIDLILLTGYLYLTRSLFRFLIVMFYFLVSAPSDRIRDFKWSQRITEMTQKNGNKLKVAIYKSVYVLTYIFKSFVFIILISPFVVFSNSDYEAEIIYLESINETKRRIAFFRFIERITLIVIVVFATLPNYTAIAKQTGVFGLILMMSIYLFKGDFTLFIKDKIADELNENTAPQRKPPPPDES